MNRIVEARATLHQAEAYRREGHFDRARAICEALVQQYPDYVGALYTLGMTLAGRDDLYGALGCLVRALNLNPKDARIQTALGHVYAKLGWDQTAINTLQNALTTNPDDAAALATLGQLYWDGKEYDAAAGAFDKAVAAAPSVVKARIGLGESYLYLGEFEKAAPVFEALYNDGTRTLRICRSLAALPESLVKIDLLAALDNLNPPNEKEREAFDSAHAFIKASALHKVGQFAEAWEHLVAANHYHYRRIPPEYARAAEVRADELARARQARAKPPIHSLSENGVPLSLFILGPSRSGKTTMERLAATLSGVRRGFESRIIMNVVARVFQTADLLTRSRIGEMVPGMWDVFRTFYSEELAERAGNARVFTNTTPSLISDALSIAQIVPNARFIFVKRNADDVAIRIYMKHYVDGTNRYAYAIGSIYDHVSWYYEMIDVAAELLPDLSRVIRYEDMIEDPRAALDTVCELCGLDPYTGDLPELGDDRGAGAPYKEYLEATLAASGRRPAVENV